MQQSTTVPSASTFAEAYPNSKKIYDETFVDTPGGRIQLRVPLRAVSLSGGEPPVRLYDTSGPQGHAPRAGLPKLRESWIEPRRADASQRKPATQLHYPRQGGITPETGWRAAAPSFRPTSITPSSSR